MLTRDDTIFMPLYSNKAGNWVKEMEEEIVMLRCSSSLALKITFKASFYLNTAPSAKNWTQAEVRLKYGGTWGGFPAGGDTQ